MSKNKSFNLVSLLKTVSLHVIVYLNIIANSGHGLPRPHTHHNYTDDYSLKSSKLVRLKYRAERAPDVETEYQIYGFRAEADAKEQWIDSGSGLTHLRLNSQIEFRFFGVQLNQSDLYIGWTETSPNEQSPACNPSKNNRFKFVSVSDFIGVSTVRITDAGLYYLCVGRKPDSVKSDSFNMHYVTDGHNTHLQLEVEAPLIPVWLQIALIILLLVLSGIFSGLNLGLMSLDKNELKVIERCGTEQEKQYAKQITPVRKRGNYLLCTLLLGNVLVNSSMTIFLDDLTSGIIAVIASTMSIVIFGEIIPQALCSRHGLAVGARTVWLTYLFMVVTFPLSYPISKLLDKILGEEIGNVYDRERLMEYIRVTKDHNRLDADEVNIISGALKLSKIKVVEIMTQLNDVFMLPYNAILDFETMTEITKYGYSRIPVYDGNKNNVVGILHAKDLAFTDPDQKMPIKALIEFYKHPLYFVYEDVTLDVMLNEFKQGKSHMAFVRKIIDDGVNDPVYELAGVVTLEDVIEELIQAEINDETDVISDNRRKQKRKEVSTRPNYSDFLRIGSSDSGQNISSQLALATYRYLSTFVEPFTSEFLSENVLKRLMSKKIYFDVKVDPNVAFESVNNIPKDYKLYVYGKASDYFILILEGRVKVVIGKENHTYECGPFSYFGISALKLTAEDTERVAKSTSLGRLSVSDVAPQIQDTTIKQSSSTISTTAYRASISDSPHPARENCFIPDYTCYCIDNTTYMKVTRDIYLAAIRTTIMERQRKSGLSLESQAEEESGIQFNASAEQPGQESAAMTANSQPSKKFSITKTSAAIRLLDDTTQVDDSGISANKTINNSLKTNSTIDDLSHNSEDSVDSLTGNQLKHNLSQTDEKSHLI